MNLQIREKQRELQRFHAFGQYILMPVTSVQVEHAWQLAPPESDSDSLVGGGDYSAQVCSRHCLHGCVPPVLEKRSC